MTSTHQHDLSHARFEKSSHSGDANTCVMVARNLAGIVAVADSTDPDGPALVFSPADWRAFTTRVMRA